jgi:hypothetical protein
VSQGTWESDSLGDPFFPDMLRLAFDGMYVRVDHITRTSENTLTRTAENFGIKRSRPIPTAVVHMDDLPMWVQRRLAVLSTFIATPQIPDVVWVGRRISEDVYWVYFPTELEDIHDGNDTRS